MYSQQIKIFVQVAEKGSLSKAAKDLFVTPASVMKQMNALEDRLNLKLIKRTNQGIELTPAGTYLYKAAKDFIRQSEKAIEKARTIQQQTVKTIRLGSSFLNPGNLLIDLWNQISPDPSEYRIKMIPYSDDRQKILSVVSSLGEEMDFMIGVFGSRQMLSLSNFFELGSFRISVAVPRNHRLASKEMLELSDLYGERLLAVKEGDAFYIDPLREMLRTCHPQIQVEDTDYFYDLETFNTCEVTGSLLLTLECWERVHPSLVTIPVNWDYKAPYGLLYAKNPTPEAAAFLESLKKALALSQNPDSFSSH